MPENQVTILSIGAAIISTLLGVIGALWRRDKTRGDKRDEDRELHLAAMEEKDKAHTEKTEELHKAMISQVEKSSLSFAKQVEKSYEEMFELMRENTNNQLNGHNALSKEIKEIDDKVNDLDKEIGLIKQQIKDK